MNKNKIYLGMAEQKEREGELDAARDLYEKSLRFRPSEQAHERLGVMLKMKGDISGAGTHFKEALRINPKNKMCIYNMGIIDRIEGKYDSSMSRYMSLKKMGVTDAGVDMSLGVLLSEMGDIDSAIKYYEKAIEGKSENRTLLFNYSLCLMTLGRYEEGLKLYENRIWHARPPGDEWKGEEDTNVLVSPEQGNGDIIQFSRYMRRLRKKCQKVIFLCNAPLVELMRRVDGIDEVVEFNPGDEFVQVEEEGGESIPYGKFLRVMSVPYALGLDPTTIPFEKYVFADKIKTAKFADMMKGKVKVGLCWQGGKRSDPEMVSIDRRRSIPLSEMGPILSVEGVEFYSLQKGDDQVKDFLFIRDMMDLNEDFTDAAAIIENLDLVISVDTAVAHLSASMGKPTWMLSRKGGCWRWGHRGESTFWYPSMRIFRQEGMFDWGSTIARVNKELKEFVQAKLG